MHDVICINDDSESSESLPQLNNLSSLQQHRKYKPTVINISDGSNDGRSSESLRQLNNVISLQRRSKYKPGPSHHRKKASKDKQKKHTSDGTEPSTCATVIPLGLNLICLPIEANLSKTSSTYKHQHLQLSP